MMSGQMTMLRFTVGRLIFAKALAVANLAN